MRTVEEVQREIEDLQKQRDELLAKADQMEKDILTIRAQAREIGTGAGFYSGKIGDLLAEIERIKEREVFDAGAPISGTTRYRVLRCGQKSADVMSDAGVTSRVTGSTKWPVGFSACHAAWVAAGRTVSK